MRRLFLIALFALAASGCLSVVRIPLENSEYSDEGECTNRVWTTVFDKRPDLRVFPTVKMRCIVTAGYFEPIPSETKGRDLYQARQFKRWGWLPLAVVWATAPVDAAVDVVFLPYDIYTKGRSAKE